MLKTPSKPMKLPLNKSPRFCTDSGAKVHDAHLSYDESPSPSLGFQVAISRIISQIMRKYPKLNSLAWNMILRGYGLPLLSRLVAFGSGFTVAADTQLGLVRFRPVFVNEVLMALGLYEPHTQEVFKAGKGQTVLDIGANIGFYTLRASRQVGPTGKVISVEANPQTFQILRANVIENCSANTLALCCAVGAEDGLSYLYVPSNYPAGSTLIHSDANSLAPQAKVPVTTVDSLVSMLGIKRVDWMKIDVEGMETAVIAGCKNVIRDHKPKIMIETMNNDIIQYLRENGYRVFPVRGVIGLVYAYPVLLSN